MKGTCLCGAVEVVANDAGQIGLCHCGMCRRWTGGPFFAVHCDDTVQFSGAALKTFRSSEWAERAFCGTCGSTLYYRLVPDGAYYVSAGLFQEQAFELASQIFIDEKPPFYALANQTPTLTGQQVFEQFAGGNGG
ncbi:GFA family protein [Stenotrophomonas acidaminiphila]|uniref:GFA family protein n=1 Tax=Stenotrophomonas acidaminiphila TaxID=128780 RepID=UPI003D02008D